MKKNMIKIVSIALALGIVSAAAPATNINVLTIKAYAANDNDDDYLDRLELNDEDGNNIKLYSDSDYDSKVNASDVEQGETYYAKASSDTVSIKIDGPDEKYVRVFNGTSSSSKGKEVGEDVDLSDDSSTTTLTIKVYGKEPDDDMRYKDNDDYNVLSTYRIKVENPNYNQSKNKDNIYLERLSVNNNKVQLSKSESTYTYNVASDVKRVTIKATPEDDDYDVTIDNKNVQSADNYKKEVDLDEGTNEFEIELEDGDKDRVYTLVINRGNPSSNGTSSQDTAEPEHQDSIYLDKLSIDGRLFSLSQSQVNYSSNVPSDVNKVTIKAEPEKDFYTVKVNGSEVFEDDDYKTTVNLKDGENKIKVDVKNENSGEERVYTLTVIRGSVTSTQNNTTGGETNSNKWVQVNGSWKYNDASGNFVKNTWVGNYYLLDNGNMATGWLNYSGSWYYLGSDGARKTGWQSVDGAWYYLDSQGKIQTGWIKDSNGKYYYLNSNGAMAYNTTVGGYRLGYDGAWIQK
ncbi:N-acetylmuramoyl-L-alanine amidase family protein [Clostridium beijerinckii]|uniref:N-acetylmuramoyl-L-alanine amidase family protein n=1 Tax=Clostridium beijerinckii TaxID=1520 RepID=UPI000809F9EE|nr:cadherin-like beta sandwich domain-containing protein [Clostridium beijerinckii]OCA97427.1 cell wall-binding protein [Clostridium beijerinckii]